MKGEQSLCNSCGNPKVTDLDAFFSAAGSTDKRCVCDFLHIGGQGEVVSDTIQICTKCCKRINEGRAGSFTQWIFRNDLCNCEAPVGKTAPVQALSEAVERQKGALEKRHEEPELAVDSAVFPVERFKPLACLGSGASGTVWKCRDRLLGTKVAVKTLHRLTPSHMIELQQEARIASKLAHPNIVKVLDLGLTPDGNPFMVSEYVDGVTLSRMLDEQCNLRISLAIDLICQLCDALDYAHERQIFHRDLKPANLIIVGPDSDEPLIKIVDFGLGVSKKAESADNQALTIVGTPQYMSPDQISGESFDSRSECYAVGCILYETICGGVPFSGETPLEIVTKQLNEEPPSLTVMGDQALSEQLDRIFKRCVAKNRNERYGFLRELKEELLEIELQTDSSRPKRNVIQTAAFRLGGSDENVGFPILIKVLIGCLTSLLLSISAVLLLGPWVTSKDIAQRAEHLSIPALKMFAGLGNPYAQTALAPYLFSGKGVERDPVLAVKYLTEASRNLPEAKGLLGYSYWKGRGVKKDKERALELFSEAASVDDPFSERCIGLMGISSPSVDSQLYFSQAARHGDAIAKPYAAIFYYSKESRTDSDLKLALRYLQESAKENIADAQFDLGILNEMGKGFSRSYENAMYWYEKASTNGDHESRYRLGLLYETVQGGDAGKKKAAECYLKAAKAGSRNAQLALSRCYSAGSGVAINADNAEYWYNKAMSHAYKSAYRHSLFDAKDHRFELDYDSNWVAKSRLAAPSIRPSLFREFLDRRPQIAGYYSHGLCTSRDLLVLECYRQVKYLELNGAEIGVHSLKALQNKQTDRILLNKCKISDEVISDIASLGDQLTGLQFKECSGFAPSSLASFKALKGLKWLNAHVPKDTIVPELPASIKELQLYVENGGLADLTCLRRLKNLTTLRLPLYQLDPEMVTLMRSVLASKGELNLILFGSKIGDAEIHMIRGLPVKQLELDYTRVTDKGILELTNSPDVRVVSTFGPKLFSKGAEEQLAKHNSRYYKRSSSVEIRTTSTIDSATESTLDMVGE